MVLVNVQICKIIPAFINLEGFFMCDTIAPHFVTQLKHAHTYHIRHHMHTTYIIHFTLEPTIVARYHRQSPQYLNTRSACLSTSADETRRLRTSSRCCILWFLPRDTTCVLNPRKCTTSLFPGHVLFVRVHEVFLCPVQLSGTVCRSLLKRPRHLTLGRSRKS